jgi:hypothetical protein
MRGAGTHIAVDAEALSFMTIQLIGPGQKLLVTECGLMLGLCTRRGKCAAPTALQTEMQDAAV